MLTQAPRVEMAKGLRPALHDLIGWFIPAGLAHSRTNRGLARMFVQTQLVGGAAGLLMVVWLARIVGTPDIALILIGAMVLVVGLLPFVLRQTGNMSLVTLASFQLLLAISLVGTFNYGGFASPFLSWLPVSLLVGLFYQSRRMGLVLSLFAASVASFFIILLFRAQPMTMSVEAMQQLSWVSIALAIVYMAFMGLYYARITASRAELEQESERYRAASVELEKTRLLAERVSRNRSLFFSKMSHELRTPLNAIIGYSEILIEDCEDDPNCNQQRKADLGRINSTGKHLLSLVSDVLDIDHLEHDATTVEPTRFTLGQLRDDVTAAALPLVEGNGNMLVVDCPMPSETVSTDQKKLRQMLINLLSNAGKFTSNGTVTMELWVERDLADDRLHAAVRDTGIGIEPDVLPRLFETYMQADAATYNRFGGTGIGLALTRKFAVLLGGEVTATSPPGEGACFTIDIPSELAVGSSVASVQRSFRGGVAAQRQQVIE
jgi:signal transduction histidine kinase